MQPSYPRNEDPDFGGPLVPVVELTVAVGTESDGVVWRVRSPFGELVDVVDLQKRLSLGGEEWYAVAELASSSGPTEGVGYYRREAQVAAARRGTPLRRRIPGWARPLT